jgi:hypothetical protein
MYSSSKVTVVTMGFTRSFSFSHLTIILEARAPMMVEELTSLSAVTKAIAPSLLLSQSDILLALCCQVRDPQSEELALSL